MQNPFAWTSSTKKQTDIQKQAPPTPGEEGTDHEAEADSGHSEDQQEDKDQRGVTAGQHRTVRAHLQQQRELC